MAMFSVPRFARSADEPMATVFSPETFWRRALPPIATLNEASIAWAMAPMPRAKLLRPVVRLCRLVAPTRC